VPLQIRNRLRKLNVDTFLTALYVMVDDFCHSHASKRRPGPDASLSPSEVITSPSSPVGPDSPARGTSTTMPQATSERPSLPFPIALSSTAWYAPTRSSSKRWPCTWQVFWRPGSVLMRLWTVQRCPSETQSEEVRVDWPVTPILDGPTLLGGMRDSVCCVP